MPERATILEWIITTALVPLAGWLGHLQLNKMSKDECKICKTDRTKFDELRTQQLNEMHSDVREVRNLLIESLKEKGYGDKADLVR